MNDDLRELMLERFGPLSELSREAYRRPPAIHRRRRVIHMTNAP